MREKSGASDASGDPRAIRWKMIKNDVVQVRRYDGGEHWLFASVVDPAAGLVEITHPGNAEHGRQYAPDAGDIRTKADVQTLYASAVQVIAAAAGRRLTDTQVRTLAASDASLLHFLQPGVTRESLTTLLPKHYQVQIDRLRTQ